MKSAISETEIQTTMKYHRTPNRLAEIKNSDDAKYRDIVVGM